MEVKKTSGQLELERIRERNKIIITDLSVCYHCKRPDIKEDEIFCPNCGFPQRGNHDDQRRFIAKFNVIKMFGDEYSAAVNKARNILFVLSVLNVLAGVLLGIVINKDIPVLIGSVLSAAIYLALGLWSRKKPFPAIITGLFVYITFIVIAALFNPASIISGLIWKGLIISGFVYGYRGAKEAEHIKEQMELKENGAISNQ